MTDRVTRFAGSAPREQQRTLLQQADDLRACEALTTAEHEQLQAILHAALRRLETAALPPAQDAGEILDAVPLDADPNAPDVLDAAELPLEERDEILDALDLEGAVDSADVLDALDLAGDEILDAVDLGDVDDRDALDAEPLDGFAANKDDRILDELPLLASGDEAGTGPDDELFRFNLSLDDTL